MSKIKNTILNKIFRSKSPLCQLISIPGAYFLFKRQGPSVLYRFPVGEQKKIKNEKEKKKISSKDTKTHLINFSRINKYILFYLSLRIYFSHSVKLRTFRHYVEKIRSHYDIKFQLINIMMTAGRLDCAEELVKNLINSLQLCGLNSEKKYQLFSTGGIVSFLLGKNSEANSLWRQAKKIHNSFSVMTTPQEYRILGSGWYSPGLIGHAAMIAFYFKKLILEGDRKSRIVFPINHFQLDSTNLLIRKFKDLGLNIINQQSLTADYNEWANDNNQISWDFLSYEEKLSLYDSFWEHEFNDGDVLSYTHAASKIQKAWESAKRPPILSLTISEKKWIEEYLLEIGVPQGAWFVCLHVREGGYHKKWNDQYPSLRDANIETYYAAIQAITDAGGWVLRMGDPSMQPIPKMPQVIDYAHSPLRHPQADLLLPVGCRFFLGTNSGYATIPSIFDVPCALTNWVPIGWPLWSRQDLMICKLFRDKTTKKFIPLEGLFERGLAFLQNRDLLPGGVEIVENNPADIRDLALEMLTALEENGSLERVGAPHFMCEKYEKLAQEYDTFTGSRFALSFIKKYPEVFKCLYSDDQEQSEQEAGKKVVSCLTARKLVTITQG